MTRLPTTDTGHMHQLELILGFHLGLPPGSETRLVDRAWTHVIQPLIRVLESREELPVALQLSGTVLDHGERHRAQLLGRLKALVRTGRVTWIMGGYYEPMLSAIPERDALGQVKLARRRSEHLVGAQPEGVRLPYGAWDPMLPRVLTRAGYRFAVADESAFLASGMAPDEIRTYVLADREGVTLPVFPDRGGWDESTSVEKAVGTLRGLAETGRGLVAWMLDARTMGLLPEDFQRTWREQRSALPRLLAYLEGQSSWLKLTSFPRALASMAPDARRLLVPAVCPRQRPHAAARGVLPASLPWEAFLARHDAARRLDDRSQEASRDVARLSSAIRTSRSRTTAAKLTAAMERSLVLLFQGQAAAARTPDPWGGVLHDHVRQRAWSALIRAEHEVARAMRDSPRFRLDMPEHGLGRSGEIRLTTPAFRASFLPAEGGAIVALESRHLGLNLLNLLQRREERCHAAAAPARLLPALVPAGEVQVAVSGDTSLVEEPTPVADETPAPSPGLASLARDRRTRAAFVDHFLGGSATCRNMAMESYPELGDFVDGAYEVLRAEPAQAGGQLELYMARDGLVREGDQESLLRVVKKFRFPKGRDGFTADYEVSNRSREPVATRFAVQLDLNVGSSPNPKIYLELDGARGELTETAEHAGIRNVAWLDEQRGMRVTISSTPPCTLWRFPLESCCQGPSGPEVRTQGFSLVMVWDLQLWGEERRRFLLNFSLGANMAAQGIPEVPGT